MQGDTMIDNEKKDQLNVRISKSLKERIKHEAITRGMTIANLIEVVLEKRFGGPSVKA
jgi:predicted DNA binding CopG/RHH family protein